MAKADNGIRTRTAPEIDSDSGRSLIICEGRYALFSIMALKFAEQITGPADLMLIGPEREFPTLNPIRSLGLFGEIWQEDVDGALAEIEALPREERVQKSKRPEQFMPTPFGGRAYTDLWLSSNSLACKHYYYALVNSGCAPKVHFVESGNESYWINCRLIANDCIPHGYFKDKSFLAIRPDLWLFEPRAFQPLHGPLQTRQIPHATLGSASFSQALGELWEHELPSRRFVFVEQHFGDIKDITNDAELLRLIASHVPEDELHIRLHPCTDVDRFSPFGFQTKRTENSLWEAALLCNSPKAEDLVLIAIDSTAAFSSIKLLDRPMTTILLDKLVWGSYRNRHRKGKAPFINQLVRQANCQDGTPRCFRPTTVEELGVICEKLASSRIGKANG